jgi:hypothetical protein
VSLLARSAGAFNVQGASSLIICDFPRSDFTIFSTQRFEHIFQQVHLLPRSCNGRKCGASAAKDSLF